MNSIIYKRLFEVRVLHDYYIMEAYKAGQATSFFSLGPADRESTLEKLIKLNQHKISDFFEIFPLDETRELFNKYNIRFVSNQLGFFLGIEVGEVKTDLGGGNAVINYQLKKISADGLHFQFAIKSKDSNLYTRTVLPSPTLLNSKFYFSNLNNLNTKTFPALSDGASGFVNGTDLKLLPFRLDINSTIGTQLKVTLLKTDGTIVIVKEKSLITNKIRLNLRQANTYVPDTPLSPDGLYEVKVEEDNVVVMQEICYLSDRLFNENNFGILDLYIDAEEPNYNLLDTDSYLKTKKDIDSGGTETITKHPIYEIRLDGIF